MIDADGSGEIDFEEFLLLLVYLEEDNGDRSEEQVLEWFKMIDIESKGYIALHDIRRVFSNMASLGGAFLEDLERDPDASVKARVIDWDEYYNKLVMDYAQKQAEGENHALPGEERITQEHFIKLMEIIDL